MTDNVAGKPLGDGTIETVVDRIVANAEPAVFRVLNESWDISSLDVRGGIERYSTALVRSIQVGEFDDLEAYLVSMDSLWSAEQFAISPIIRSLFVIQDAACDAWTCTDPDESRYVNELLNEYTRRAIECISERSVMLVMGRLARQVEQHREGEARLMSLQRVGAALVSDLDLDRSLQLIADEARRLIAADGVLMRMATEDGSALEFITGSGNEGLFMPTTLLPVDSSLSGDALRTGSPKRVNDIRVDERVSREYLTSSNSRSLLIVPLISRDRPVGVITGTSVNVAAFSDQDISILSLFADQAASAVENARLFKQAHQQIDELGALHRVSQLVSSSLDLEEIFQTLYEEVNRLMPADSFLVALARPDGLHDFEFIIDNGQRFPPRRGLSLSPILSEDLSQGEMVIRRDVTTHPQYRFANRFGETDHQVKSVLAAPLKRGDQVIGMISAQSYTEHDYRDPEARMLRTIASQAAIAIEHARLYREAQNVAVAEERARLAREIHDTLAQGLIGVILCLERLDLAIPTDDKSYRPWVERALDLSRSSLEEARRSVRDLRAAPLEGRTLLEAVANLVADVRDSYDFEVLARLPTSLPPISARVETALFRVIQEAVFNACKHAECDRLMVELESDGSTLLVRVIDNGIGFEPATGDIPSERYGLTTMRERVSQIGGGIQISSAEGNGTTVQVELPVQIAVHQESGRQPDASDSGRA
jgi:signal transduction histidine kinase